MRACFGSFEKPRGKILHNHSISLQDRSDSEMEGKPPSTYAPLSTISISSCCEWTRASHTHARRASSRCCRKRRAFPEAYRTKCVSTLEASAQAENRGRGRRSWSRYRRPTSWSPTAAAASPRPCARPGPGPRCRDACLDWLHYPGQSREVIESEKESMADPEATMAFRRRP